MTRVAMTIELIHTLTAATLNGWPEPNLTLNNTVTLIIYDSTINHRTRAYLPHRGIAKPPRSTSHWQPECRWSVGVLSTQKNINKKILTSSDVKSNCHHLHHSQHAPLGVCSAKRRHQSPEWTILSQHASFRERLLDFRSCWIVFIHVVRGRPGGLFQFSKGEAVKIFLASVSSVILIYILSL